MSAVRKRFFIQFGCFAFALVVAEASAASPLREEKWLEAATHEPITERNRVELLVDGPEYFPVRLEMIRNAKRTIDLQTYLFCDDVAGIQVAEELARAKRRNPQLRVRFITDFFNFKAHRQVYGILESAGIPLLIYNPPAWSWGNLQRHIHEKVMVTDGARALVGGPNLCDEYMTGKEVRLWHDLEVLAQGPLLARIQARFDETWNRMAREDYDSRDGLQNAFSGPDSQVRVPRRYPIYKNPTPAVAEPAGDADAHYLYQQSNYRDRAKRESFEDVFIRLIQGASREVTIYAPYLIPTRKFERALIDAAKRVRVRILTNSVEFNDMGKAFVLASLSHYAKLIAEGVEIHEFKKTTIHAKALLVDDRLLMVGSHNYTPRSFAWNGEANILTDDRQAIERFQRMMAEDFANSERTTAEQARARSKGFFNALTSFVMKRLEFFF